ncbi:MAG: hypothetical protein ACTSRH_12905 [Promethearchaeota archaeon]
MNSEKINSKMDWRAHTEIILRGETNFIKEKTAFFAKIFMENIMVKDFNDKLKVHEAPTLDQLKEAGYNKFVNIISSYGIHYSDLLRVVGLKPNQIDWCNIVDKTKDGRPTTRKEKIIIFAKILIEKIMVNNFKAKLRNRKAPTIEQLKDAGYGAFISAFVRRKIKYSEILKEANLIEKNKNSKFKELTSMKKFTTYEKKLALCAKIFKEEIMTEEFKNDLKLKDGEAPTLNQLREVGYNTFVNYLSTWGIHYSDLLKVLNLKKSSKVKKNLYCGYYYKKEIKETTEVNKALLTFLTSIAQNHFPAELYKYEQIFVSNPKFIGGNYNYINYSELKEELIRREILIKMEDPYNIVSLTRKIIDFYNNKYKFIPNHGYILPILFKILNFIKGIEVFLWKKVRILSNGQDSFSYIVGRADLIGLLENNILMIEYKKSIKELTYSIPQVFSYAHLLKERLQDINDGLDYRIICIVFSSDYAYVFYYEEMKEFLIERLNNENNNITGNQFFHLLLKN